MINDALTDNRHIYVFVDERAPGWGTRFLNSAKNPDASERKTLLNSIISYQGFELWKTNTLTLVFPSDWMRVFRLINTDPNTLRPDLNWIAEEYLIYNDIITERLSEGEKLKKLSLDNWNNYYYVVYNVDITNKCIIR